MDFKTRLSRLIDVKTLVTFAVVGALTYGFIARFVSVEVFAPIVLSVITFYFTKKESGGEG